VKIKQLDYDSKELSILKKWKYGESWKDTPKNISLQLTLFLDKSKDARLLKDLAAFALPPFHKMDIRSISQAAEEANHFLTYSLWKLNELYFNWSWWGDVLDGSGWVDAIAKALPRVEKRVDLWHFSFSKKQVETIIDNSMHLKYLGIKECVFRK
jgi:hypothetical protein